MLFQCASPNPQGASGWTRGAATGNEQLVRGCSLPLCPCGGFSPFTKGIVYTGKHTGLYNGDICLSGQDGSPLREATATRM